MGLLCASSTRAPPRLRLRLTPAQHLNSVDKDEAGNFLISSRHTHAVYYVSGADGSTIWTMGGMNSSFAMGNGTNFSWQHDASWVIPGTQIR